MKDILENIVLILTIIHLLKELKPKKKKRPPRRKRK